MDDGTGANLLCISLGGLGTTFVFRFFCAKELVFVKDMLFVGAVMDEMR